MNDTGGVLRDDVHMNIKSHCWKEVRGLVDYVIVCDIDEFLYHPNMESLFKELREIEADLIQPEGYEMVADPTHPVPSSDKNLFEEIPYGWKADNYSKLVLFNPNTIREMNYGPGCHEEFRTEPIIPMDNNQPRALIKPDGLKLLHYKDLSLDYKLKRNKELGTRLSESNKQRGWGNHYLRTDEVVEEKYLNNWNNKRELVYP